jgi:hypothetical protein
MGKKSKWEYFRAIYPRYRKASSAEKTQILEEFCEVCGYNRKYAITKLNGPFPEPNTPAKRHKRCSKYTSQALLILRGYDIDPTLSPLKAPAMKADEEALPRRQRSCAGKFFEQLDCFCVARDLFNYFRLLFRHQRRRFISAGKCAPVSFRLAAMTLKSALSDSTNVPFPLIRWACRSQYCPVLMNIKRHG